MSNQVDTALLLLMSQNSIYGSWRTSRSTMRSNSHNMSQQRNFRLDFAAHCLHSKRKHIYERYIFFSYIPKSFVEICLNCCSIWSSATFFDSHKWNVVTSKAMVECQLDLTSIINYYIWGYFRRYNQQYKGNKNMTLLLIFHWLIQIYWNVIRTLKKWQEIISRAVVSKGILSRWNNPKASGKFVVEFA